MNIKVITGDELYNLSKNKLENSNWKYCGGDKGRHLRYFNLVFKSAQIPQHTVNCVCGHHIIENCFITDGNEIKVLGNCCIKKFIPSSGRTCERCKRPHKNRSINQCNICKKNKYCKICDAIHCNKKVNRCNSCMDGYCEICEKKISGLYSKCYTCKFPKIE